jgi:hypothetical protein
MTNPPTPAFPAIDNATLDRLGESEARIRFLSEGLPAFTQKKDRNDSNENGRNAGRSLVQSIRLNHARDSSAEDNASRAARAEKSAVTSVSFFSSTKRELSAW